MKSILVVYFKMHYKYKFRHLSFSFIYFSFHFLLFIFSFLFLQHCLCINHFAIINHKSNSLIILFCSYSHIFLLPTTEVRQEAVQQALAALKNRPKPSLPMPSKRSSVLNRSPDRDRDDTGWYILF